MKHIKNVIFILFLVLGLLLVGYNECHYYRYGYFNKCDNNIYEFIDNQNNIWILESENNINTDKQVKVLMFDNHTINVIKDDIIIDFEYINQS